MIFFLFYLIILVFAVVPTGESIPTITATSPLTAAERWIVDSLFHFMAHVEVELSPLFPVFTSAFTSREKVEKEEYTPTLALATIATLPFTAIERSLVDSLCHLAAHVRVKLPPLSPVFTLASTLIAEVEEEEDDSAALRARL